MYGGNIYSLFDKNKKYRKTIKKYCKIIKMCYNKFEGSDFMKVKGKNSIGSLLKFFVWL